MNGGRREAGFALASAVFLLVILAALGAFIAHLSVTQSQGEVLDVAGERAYQAARGGMEWVRYQVSTTGACPAGTPWGGSAATSSLQYPAGTLLSPYPVSVECSLSQSTDVNGVATTLFEVRATACNKPAAAEPLCPPSGNANVGATGYVERQLQGLLSL